MRFFMCVSNHFTKGQVGIYDRKTEMFAPFGSVYVDEDIQTVNWNLELLNENNDRVSYYFWQTY